MKYIIITFLAAATFACSNAATPVAQNTKSAPATSANDRSQTAIAHGPENQQPSTSAPATGPKSKWTQGGDPIDTAELDAAVSTAEKAAAAKPADAVAKKALATAFLKRAMALTDARQYAAALGDYRKALKNDASNAEAKEWIERIISIYDSIGRESPKEGEEPPPLPFTKK